MSKPKIDVSASATTLTRTSKDTPETPSVARRSLTRQVSRELSAFLWPIVAIVTLHRTWVLPKDVSSTNDFTTIQSAINRFISQVSVYSENCVATDPHYLYSPGAILLLAPIDLFGSLKPGRIWSVIFQSATIIAAIVLLLRWPGIARSNPITPVSIALLYLTEPVTNTLDFTSINGSLFLTLVLFFIALTERRSILAGLIIGIVIAIKSVFLPMLFLPFMHRQFSTVLTSIGVVIAANVIAQPLMVQPRNYLNITVPCLGVVRDFTSASLTGRLVWLGARPTLVLLWQIFFGVFVLVFVVPLLHWLERGEKFWIATTSGVLFTGAFFLSSLGQQYYSIALLPMVPTVPRPLVLGRDNGGNIGLIIMLSQGAGLGVVLCFFYANWQIDEDGLFFPWFMVTIGGTGWAVLILSIAAALIRMAIVDAVNGRSFASGFNWLSDWRFADGESNQESDLKSKRTIQNG